MNCCAYTYTYDTIHELPCAFASLHTAGPKEWSCWEVMPAGPDRHLNHALFFSSTFCPQLNNSRVQRNLEPQSTQTAYVHLSAPSLKSGSLSHRSLTCTAIYVTSTQPVLKYHVDLLHSHGLNITVALSQSRLCYMALTVQPTSRSSTGTCKGESGKIDAGSECRWEPSSEPAQINLQVYQPNNP